MGWECAGRHGKHCVLRSWWMLLYGRAACLWRVRYLLLVPSDLPCPPACAGCSDGLFDVMSAQQAVDSASQVISKHGAPSSAHSALACLLRQSAKRCVRCCLQLPAWRWRSAAAQKCSAAQPLLAGTAAEAAADALVQQALQAGTSDNVTALVMLLDWAGQLPQQQQAA